MMPSTPSVDADTSGPASVGAPADLPVILFVDDEPQSCKWFARTFADEFKVLTATSVDDALTLLRERGQSVALLVTDYRMPQRNGLDLLLAVQRDHKHLVRLLATAYAEKEVAIAAINEGHGFRILEKPLDLVQTRLILREAMTLHRAQTLAILAQLLHQLVRLLIRTHRLAIEITVDVLLGDLDLFLLGNLLALLFGRLLCSGDLEPRIVNGLEKVALLLLQTCRCDFEPLLLVF